MENSNNNLSNFILYQSSQGNIGVQVIIDEKSETIWATEKTIAEIFNVDRSVINKHLSNIFKDGELDKNSVCAKFAHTAKDGKTYHTNFYNIDVILSVGYRVNSAEATHFRKWANNILKEYLIKGFAINDDKLKQGKQLFNKDYFSELLEKIREIRASERVFYQKITDIYATSIDYDVNSQITKDFYATVQNKLHWAIHNQTAAELITSRVDSAKKNMGLTSWKNEKKGGKILKSDVSIAKNYLTQEEISQLNRIVSMYLDYAENMAERNKEMRMTDWIKKLDSFLEFNEYNILTHSGKITAQFAKNKAEKEYEKFRVIQDAEYKSDFDKKVEENLMSLNDSLNNIDSPTIKSIDNLSQISKFKKK